MLVSLPTNDYLVLGIVWWLQTKEKHCDQLTDIVTCQFMSQRIKPVEKADSKACQKHMKELTLLHRILVFNMKAKQTTDLSNIEKLKALLADFRAAYFKTAIVKD